MYHFNNLELQEFLIDLNISAFFMMSENHYHRFTDPRNFELRIVEGRDLRTTVTIFVPKCPLNLDKGIFLCGMTVELSLKACANG